MVKKMLLILALVSLLFTSFGCQTLEGLGKDLEWTGQKMGEAVN